MKKVFIKTFGCRVNQVESQALREEFLKQGCVFTDAFENADICLLNTCTVTAKADSDVEKLARRVTNRNPMARLILTGCYAAAHEEKIKQNFPSAEIINKHNIAKTLFDTDDDFWAVSGNEGRSRAFIKIQDGCDNFCSYCIIPFARNKKLSKPMSSTVNEIRDLISKGFKEIVLTGINIGNYLCPRTGADLAALLKEIFKIEGEYRIRFSSIELNTVTDGLLAAAKEGGSKFCNYFHIPLQSGSDLVLKDMNRRYLTKDYAKRIGEIKAMFPGIGIYADIIAGYPVETEEEFEKSYNFIKETALNGLHVFSYSVRPGTKAANLPQLNPVEIKRRSDKLRELDFALRREFAALQKGQTLETLVERKKGEFNTGVAGNFVRVDFKGKAKAGSLVKVKITSAQDGVCIGETL